MSCAKFSTAALFDAARQKASEAFATMRAKLAVQGLTLEMPSWEGSAVSIERDPDSGSDVLVGIWQASDGDRTGRWAVRSDGSCLAEMDVLVLHPRVPRLLVESVSVFGDGSYFDSRVEYRPLPYSVGARR